MRALILLVATSSAWAVPPSAVCPTVYAPVCGVDGATYGNACEAQAAGVAIDHPGECAPATCMAYWEGWSVDSTGACVFGGASGCSSPFPYETEADCLADLVPDPGCLCNRLWAPVCGVDGQTYGNDCEAECAEVEIAFEGECAGACDAWFEGWSVDASGACVFGGASGCDNPFPYETEADCLGDLGDPGCVCTEEYAPVCGVDGQTYSNACHADCAAVEIASTGECVDECDAYWEGWSVDASGACVFGGASGCDNPFPYETEADCLGALTPPEEPVDTDVPADDPADSGAPIDPVPGDSDDPDDSGAPPAGGGSSSTPSGGGSGAGATLVPVFPGCNTARGGAGWLALVALLGLRRRRA